MTNIQTDNLFFFFKGHDHPQNLPSSPPPPSSNLSSAAARPRRSCRLERSVRAHTSRAQQSSPSHATCNRSEEHTSELQSLAYLVCRLLLEKKKVQIESRTGIAGIKSASGFQSVTD